MSFADPDDVDEEPSADADEADAEITENPASAADTVQLEWAGEGEVPLDEAIKANASVLRGKADEVAVESLEDYVEALREKVADLREERDDLRDEVDTLRGEVDGLTERVEALESWRGGTVSTVNQNIADINRLAAVVFNNEPPCPECDGGRLEANTGGFGDDTVGCTECEYEETLG
jgi:polyhydroxyalkanoate synthesis regulator phasin